MPLTDIQIRAAKSNGDKPRKLSDGGGLQLWAMPLPGSRLWRLAYRFGGKQKKLSIGPYPAVSLKAARDERQAAKAMLAQGIDPGAHKKASALTKANTAANTFGKMADRLVAMKREESRSASTLSKAEWLLGMAKQSFGHRPVAEVSAQEILALLEQVQVRGHHETAKRLRGIISEVFCLAVVKGQAAGDPTAALRRALVSVKAKPRSAIVDPEGFGGLLRAIDSYRGSIEVRLALQLLALTFVRPGELRFAKPAEFDLKAAVWTVPAARMKMRQTHFVPLSKQAVAIIEQLKTLHGERALLFPSALGDSRPISENTMNSALRRLGIGAEEHCAHGFRSSASSLLNESGKWNPDAIEAQLAHADRDTIRGTYNRSPYWKERFEMMAWWADHLDTLRSGAQVIALPVR